MVTATVATRNAGSNPFTYAASPASIGEDSKLTVFTVVTGHTSALVIGFDTAIQATLSGGQVLLCIGSSELVNTGFQSGPLSTFTLPIPNDPTLVGTTICTQAVHAFGTSPFALSNAQDLVIGGCP